MFDNIGSKLKSIARGYTIVGMVLVILVAIVLLFSAGFLAVIYGVLGCLGVWITGCVIYGIGQTVENTDKLVKKLVPEEPEPVQPAAVQPAQKRSPWICVSCGTENQGHVPYCNGCGISREWSQSQKTNGSAEL